MSRAIVYHFNESQMDRLPELVTDLIRRQVTVIAAMSTVAAVTAKTATTTIPIVFVAAEDPVRIGLVASLARPGGNATGVNFFVGELTAKRLELLRKLVPAIARVAVLVDPNNVAGTESTLRDVEPAAHAMGLQIQVVRAGTSGSSTRLLKVSYATASTHSLSAPRAFSPADASTLRTERCAMEFPRSITSVSFPRSAGS